MADYSSSIDIDAPAEVVFDHLTTAEGMTAWMGQHAELDPVAGGEFAVDINGTPIRGSYVEVDPPRRLVVTWGVAGSDDFPVGSSRVEFTLTPTAGGTRLQLVHTDLPEPKRAGYASGWVHFLDRLHTVATGGDPGPDTFAATTPRELFDALAAEQLRLPGVRMGRAMRKDVLQVGGKTFAFVTRDRLVVKLPAEVAAAMVSAGEAVPFESGGRPTREWVKVPVPTLWSGRQRCRELVANARRYVETLTITPR
jgi:uncharacterized protein YndB with AHSA1/START domain